MSLCLAGRFSVVSRAGSWPDLHLHARGTVRLFLCLGVASCVGSLNPPRGHPMLLLDSSSTLHSLSSGRQYFRRGSICLYQGDILTQQLSHSLIRNASSRSDFRSAGSINTYHADMGISVPVPAFFVSRNTQKPFPSAYSEHNGCSCFSLGCQ